MSMKGRTHQKNTVGRPLAGSESTLSRTSAIGNTLTKREAAVLTAEQDVLNREKNADNRQDAADLRDKDLLAKIETARVKAGPNSHTDDLLLKVNEQLVVASVRAQTMTESAEKTAEQMTHIAKHDFLTGLPNRALLNDRLERSIALAKRRGKRVALMYMDIDHFKHINDSLGHAVGDQLLQSIAKRLHASASRIPSAAREATNSLCCWPMSKMHRAPPLPLKS
jgi:Diguanylate cyclase, GGDEF domain